MGLKYVMNEGYVAKMSWMKGMRFDELKNVMAGGYAVCRV